MTGSNERGFSSDKGIIAAVLLIVLLGVGYFIYNKKTSSTPPSAVDLLASLNPAPAEKPASGSASNGEEISITVSAQNSSGQDGVAILKDLDGKTVVTLKVTGAPSSAEPAHIHTGSCPNPGEVKFPLTAVVNGVSETILDVSVAEIKYLLPLAINIHKSAEDLKTYVSCGDIR